MDTDSGRFVEEARSKDWMQRIEVGEVIKIKGAECEVTEFGDRTITLKLLSADERLMNSLGIKPITSIEAMNRHERRRIESVARKWKK